MKIIKIVNIKAKMHQIQYRLGSAPDPTVRAYSAPPDSLAGFKGPTSKGREEGRREGRSPLYFFLHICTHGKENRLIKGTRLTVNDLTCLVNQTPANQELSWIPFSSLEHNG